MVDTTWCRDQDVCEVCQRGTPARDHRCQRRKRRSGSAAQRGTARAEPDDERRRRTTPMTATGLGRGRQPLEGRRSRHWGQKQHRRPEGRRCSDTRRRIPASRSIRWREP